ncbi:MAG: OmpA family protein, partial [Halioglobus sp.]
TDNVGPEDYNMGLSQRRAQAVVDVLVNQHGIDASRLSPVGFGETQPVASNDTEEGRAQNRRVMATLEVEFEE